MNIDTYYRFEKSNTKSKTRYDLVFNKGYYEPLHQTNKNDECWIYFGNNPHIKTRDERKSDIAISTRAGHLTSVFIPDIDKPNLAYGDFGNDAFLIVINVNIEIMVLKGQKHIQTTLNNLFLDGEFDEDLKEFRALFTASKQTELNMVNLGGK